ncbi:hypothetical protein JCM5296_003833, partial [Sporobolomyces johnsonii]
MLNRLLPGRLSSSRLSCTVRAAALLDSCSRRSATSLARRPHLSSESFSQLNPLQRRPFGTAPAQIKPFMLADIGEGITECEIVK